MKTVRYKANNLPPLTEKDYKELEALKKMPDSSIDYSDIPPLTQEFLEKGIRGMMYRPVKQSITIRMDSDVISWLKSKGKGYQTRLNQLAREAMKNELLNRSP